MNVGSKMEDIFIIQLVVVLFVSSIVQFVLKKKVKRFTTSFIHASIMLTVLPIIWARGFELQAVQVTFFKSSISLLYISIYAGHLGLILVFNGKRK